MERIELKIYDAASNTEKVSVNKWKFQDAVMGERFISFTITSEVPIDWSVGDYCVFRDETFTLNYVPSVTQKASVSAVQDGFTYENVKLDSCQEELVRCMMLDVTPTTDEYIAVLGTNHTGSSRFQLYCGETTVNGDTLTPVCALALKMQANLDRLYPNAWKVYVDTTTTYTNASGEQVLVTHTDSKLLTFDNTTVAAALAMVNSEFKLDYSVRYRNIYIGYTPNNLTADDLGEVFAFGYGKGYPSVENQGKGLFQIKQIANSQQKIVTRLRALGSTKNLPYNYYFKKYGLLSQALFPNNLQLPGTFLPLGLPSDTADADGQTKWSQNNARSEYLRKVLGDTNDSYIDKNDDAENCYEGIREDCARWDGSNSDLPEIYPTIEGVTFGELRNAGVADQTGETGEDAYQGASVQLDSERIDCLLAVGYTDNGVLIDDANVGDGVMPESDIVDVGTHFTVGIGETRLAYNPQSGHGDFSETSPFYLEGAERVLFTVNDVSPGDYFMVPTGPSYSSVAYRFGIIAASSATASVGFIVRVKQKTGSNYTTIAEWVSQLVTVGSASNEREMYLPELPDEGTSGQVSSIHVTTLSDVVVTFAPIISNVVSDGQITLYYKVGRSQSGEYDPEYTWSAVQGDVASKYPFHVFIKDMGFDLTTTFNGETPLMSMKSGACVGREFEIGENVQKATVNGIRGYLLTLNRVEDSNLHIYYPNQYYPLAAGDYFVLLNINMPDAYIRAAEARLLAAATEYLADNCDTKYTYQPFIDDIYLQRNIDAMEAAGTPEKSIFWRLYAGMKFQFNGIPSSADAPLPLVEMAIEQVTITMGESLTPKVELVLNDDVQQSTLQKLTIAVDRIYNGSLFSSGGGGANLEAIANIGNRLFLSRIHDDIANGRITFNDIATFNKLLKANDGINAGEFLSGFLGAGAHIGADGRAEFEEINLRGALRAAELVFNQIRAEGGEKIESIGYGEILTVDEENMTATLKLDGNEWATIDVDDICRGLYNTIGKDYDNSNIAETEDTNGFRTKKGFFASYFKIEEILTNAKGECEFRYSLQPGTTEHPCPLMKFAVYGNFNRYEETAKKARQSCIYTTAVGVAPRMLYLAGVNDWQIKPYNIKVAIGNIEGVNVYELLDGVPSLKTLHGDAGIFVEDNIYLGGILNQFTSADWDTLRDELGQGIHAQLIVGSDNIVVDALGNVVGGLVIEGTDGTTVTHQYKLHTGVIVYDSAKERYLTIGESGNLQDGEFAMYVSANGCTVTQDGADVYVTAIDNTANGTVLTDEQLEAMRNTEGFAVDFVIVTASGWRTQMSYPVKITHLDQAFITFDLTNEMDSMAYSSQLRKYLGLPITSSLKAYVNGVEVNDFVSVSMSSNAFTGTKTTDNAMQAATGYFGDSTNSKLQARLTLGGLFTIVQGEHNVPDLEDTKYWFDLSCVVKYAGVQYTSPMKRLTVQETTDATLYKLLLSANAVSKNEDIYVPDTIDIKVQVIDSVGTHVYTAAEMNASGNIKVRYVNGIYGESAVISTMPDFSDVPTCLTVVLRDETDANNPVVLDLESVPMTAVGRNGAGQPWVKVNYDSFTIDCDSDGNILGSSNVPIIVSAELYWGDQICDLQSANCQIYLKGETPSGASNVYSNHADKSFTFAAGTFFESTDIIISLTGLDNDNEPHTATKTIPIIANCKGEKGDDGDAGAAVRFRGNYSQDVDFETGYIWNSYFRDCVKEGSSYYLVKDHSNGSEPLGRPNGSSNTKWEDIGGMNFVATELLLAENAVIDLLYSNIIRMRDSNGNLTATINEDQNGSYCIYYKGGHNKRMEFSYDGFIYYYNDDAVNSKAWWIGHGGDIHKGSSDDWQLFPLHKLTPEELSNLSSNSRFNLTDYWRFVAGTGSQWAADFNGCLYVDIPNDRNPSNGIYVEEGYYTPNFFPFEDVETMDAPSVPAITLYTVASVDGNVKITNTTIFKQGDTIE